MSRRNDGTYLSLPFQQHSNLSKMQSFSYKEQSLLRRYSWTWKQTRVLAQASRPTRTSSQPTFANCPLCLAFSTKRWSQTWYNQHKKTNLTYGVHTKYGATAYSFIKLLNWMLYRDISIYIALQFSHCNPLNSGSVSHTAENKSFDSVIIHPIISLWCHITAASKNNLLVLKASGAEVNRKDDASDCWQTAVSAGQRGGSNDAWMLASWIFLATRELWTAIHAP